MANDFIFLVLAAGQSRRFGTQKLGHPFAENKSIIEHTLESINATGKSMSVIVSPNSEAAIRAARKLNLPACRFTQPSPGLGDSIRFGIEQNLHHDGWIICLADMPYIPTSIYQQVFELAERHSLVAPECDGQQGHPVFFAARYREELRQLRGDKGANGILRRHASALHLFACEHFSVLHDIDEPSDIR